MNGLSTPRQVTEALNALHNYRLRVTVDGRLEFAPRPDKPLFRVGAWSGAEFKDASKNSGDEIYNQEIVEGAFADGSRARVSRSAAHVGIETAPVEGITSPYLPNPSFDSDASGWAVDEAAGTYTLTRVTDTFDSAPASLRWAYVSGLPTLPYMSAQFTGTFKRGVAYVLEFSSLRPAPIRVWFGDLPAAGRPPVGGGDFAEVLLLFNAAFEPHRLLWVPSKDVTVARVRFSGALFDSGPLYVDSFRLSRADPTLPDRRGFLKTHVTSFSPTLTEPVAAQIADTFLATHKRTPLRGDITIKGRHGLRRMQGDATVPPSELLLHTGELIHLADQIDPDTGALGRDAPIDSVTWNADEDTVSVALDAKRDNLAALLARYDLVAGNRR